MQTNYTITITELKYDEVGEKTQNNMLAEINEKLKNEPLEGMLPNDYLFYGVIIGKDDIRYYTDDVWLTRDSLFQSLETRLKRIDRGLEPIFFSSDETKLEVAVNE